MRQRETEAEVGGDEVKICQVETQKRNKQRLGSQRIPRSGEALGVREQWSEGHVEELGTRELGCRWGERGSLREPGTSCLTLGVHWVFYPRSTY